MNTTMIVGLIRDLLKISGGTMLVSDNELGTIIGAVMTVITVGWSIYERIKASKTPKE